MAYMAYGSEWDGKDASQVPMLLVGSAGTADTGPLLRVSRRAVSPLRRAGPSWLAGADRKAGADMWTQRIAGVSHFSLIAHIDDLDERVREVGERLVVARDAAQLDVGRAEDREHQLEQQALELAAVPAVPITTVGTIRCSRIDLNLSQLIG